MLSLKQKKQQEAYDNDVKNSQPSKSSLEKVQVTVENITKTLENICK